MDLVIPYVNGADNAWQQVYLKTLGSTVGNSVRFRSWGTLKYLFRGVAKYMPFIDRIVLIVSDVSQVPVWVNKNIVKVVYHKDFIPKRHLPTFNSCTIESFLYNIPDLSDRFIYANDDMFPINGCTIEDFFTYDKPNLKFVVHEKYTPEAVFRCQCRSGLDMITKALNLPEYPKGYIIRPYHITTPMTIKSLQEVKALCENKIPKTISKLRENYNVNQYIYSYYQYFTQNYEDSIVSYKYLEIKDTTLPEIKEIILNSEYQWVCLNDSKHIKDYSKARGMLLDTFKSKFPERCQFEL